MTAMCLVRRRPGERYGFNLSKFIGRGQFLPKGNPVVCDIFAYKEDEKWVENIGLIGGRLVAVLAAESTDSLPRISL